MMQPLLEKKKGAKYRFNTPRAASDKTRTVHPRRRLMKRQSKKLIYKVLYYIVTIGDWPDLTLSEILEKCGVTLEQYGNALGCVEKNVSIFYK